MACNEHGERIGEDHQNAKLTNLQVDAIRDRYEAMKAAQDAGGPRVALKPLAVEFGVAYSTIKSVVFFHRHNVTPARWKRVDK